MEARGTTPAGRLVAWLAGVALLAATPAAAQSLQIRWLHSTPVPCPDCDADGSVTVDELVTHVSIALDVTPLEACAAGDTDGDGVIAVHEVIGAVQAALSGCWLDEALVADGAGGEHLEVARQGETLRIVVADRGGTWIDHSLDIAGWQPGRAYDIAATWRDGSVLLHVDGALVVGP